MLVLILSDGREGPGFDAQLREIWELNVVRPFAARFRLWGSDGPPPEEAPVRRRAIPLF